MEKCAHCGSEIPDGVKFCTNCGAPRGAETPKAQSAPNAAQESAVVLRDGSAVLKTAGFFWAGFGMCIPVLGLALTIIWACGACKNLNLRNFSRAMLIWRIIALVLLIAGAVLTYVLYGPQITQFISEYGAIVASDTATW